MSGDVINGRTRNNATIRDVIKQTLGKDTFNSLSSPQKDRLEEAMKLKIKNSLEADRTLYVKTVKTQIEKDTSNQERSR